ncbi:MAG: glutamate formimidoyltransferase [Bacteroidales bacterium]|nr:glutamate formimidoyltransferase [Bacteroidales bacterium]MCF8392027.1 glutamate formimidoyltransferase [Bacteroidales bacterium]
MQKIIECVPNYSEGIDMNIIKLITNEIESVEGVKLLDVDPGKATNRTVVTFVGEPEPVVEAAFRAVKTASELIDMTKHRGEHPRFGATDVCPLIPISGITMEETVVYARELGKRIGEELKIPVYCYESAAFSKERKNLAYVRSGEYEGLKEKLERPEWKPDFGPAVFNSKAGATAVGARDFLVAYNVNLNTTSTRRANAIAFDVREKGRILRKGDPITGEIVKDENGNPVTVPGSLKSVKAIGWFIEEYGVAQISMNLTNLSICSLHEAYDEVWKKAEERGVRVSGSELVGLVPLKSVLDAGRYFLMKQKRSIGISDKELIKIAIKSMGLDDLYPFNPNEKIIEYAMDKDRKQKNLADLSVYEFMNETASESPAPGGGSVSALMGSLGTSLATMVANLSSHKRGWDDKWEEYSNWADKGKSIQESLMKMVDEDTRAFNRIMEAFQLSGTTEKEKMNKKAAIQEATKNAILVPFNVMKISFSAFELIEAMAKTGNPNSVSDVGVGALAIRSAIRGAWLNVKINSAVLEDKIFVNKIYEEARHILLESDRKESLILKIVDDKIG